jgi:hypothetical protein
MVGLLRYQRTGRMVWSLPIKIWFYSNRRITMIVRIKELENMKIEFIFNESEFVDENPSWLEVAEAQAKAEMKWYETDNGKELEELLMINNNEIMDRIYDTLMENTVDGNPLYPKFLDDNVSNQFVDAREGQMYFEYQGKAYYLILKETEPLTD